MGGKLGEFVRYRFDRLFDGAVDVDWLTRDPARAARVARGYVFHGPAYHGVTQDDIGVAHSHQLVDTATFTLNVLRRCNGAEEKPFTLAIAGYGTGKSHLATALSALLAQPSSTEADSVLENLATADAAISEDACRELNAMRSPALVVALNGMGHFDLASEFARQVVHFVREAGQDPRSVDELRPRFSTAAKLVSLLPPEEQGRLADMSGLADTSQVLAKLSEHDEAVYAVAHDHLAGFGLPIKAIGDETIKDLIETVCRDYVGEGLPFSRLVVLFDEFGEYAKFATQRSQIAGSGVLQQLYEGVQACADKATFVGFIQFDLNTYVQRLGREYQNEILRVSTRYQSAEKAYLSLNLETLLASLLEKNDVPALEQYFSTPAQMAASERHVAALNTWYPQSRSHRLWKDAGEFHRVIRKGCWPLSPCAAWLLFRLAAGGQHLQQRSALSLLNEVSQQLADLQIAGYDWQLHAVDIWTETLEKELRNAEEVEGNLGSVTDAYATVMAKAGEGITVEERNVLRSVVLASKLGLVARNRGDALEALAALTGTGVSSLTQAVMSLEQERNVLSWDERFNQFEIVGDSASRPQFLAFLRQKTAAAYGDSHSRGQLFVRRASEWCPDVLSDITCDFAEEHKISTQEWYFRSSVTNLDELPRVLAEATKSWHDALAVDEPRGGIVYCYVEPETDIARVQTEASALLKRMAQNEGVHAVPLWIVFLHDDGSVGQCVAELAVLSEGLSEQDKARFGQLVGVHRKNCQDLLTSRLKDQVKQRTYALPISGLPEHSRLSVLGTSIFEAIYSHVLPFPFDGFSTARGNAADSCHDLTLALCRGELTYNVVMSMPPKNKNRAVNVLHNCWGVFGKNGEVTLRAQNAAVRALLGAWDERMGVGGAVALSQLVGIALRPPYGANIAEAGLMLGVYLSGGNGKYAVNKDGSQLQLADLGDGMLFRGKYLDLQRLAPLQLAPQVQPLKSPWVTFLDEWEAASDGTYAEQVEFLVKSFGMRERSAVPRDQLSRFGMLQKQAEGASAKLNALKGTGQRLLDSIEKAERLGDLHKLTYAAINLKRAAEDVRADARCPQELAAQWEEEVNRVRQVTIQLFGTWLPQQEPNGCNAVAASEFAQHMKETSDNLGRLGLNEEKAATDRHTETALQLINLVAEAQNLTNSINTWVVAHDPTKMLRVMELRDCRKAASDYFSQGETLVKKVPMQLPELRTGLERLSKLLAEVIVREQSFGRRASELWNRPFAPESIEEMLAEAQDLERAFEGCENDVADFRLMRRALVTYRAAFERLQDEQLPKKALESLYAELSSAADAELAQQEPPWPPAEAMAVVFGVVLDMREKKGGDWLLRMGREVDGIKELDIAGASNLYGRLEQEPAYLSDEQRAAAAGLRETVREYLSGLKVEWLINEYLQLAPPAQEEFRRRISGRPGPTQDSANER